MLPSFHGRDNWNIGTGNGHIHARELMRPIFSSSFFAIAFIFKRILIKIGTEANFNALFPMALEFLGLTNQKVFKYRSPISDFDVFLQ